MARKWDYLRTVNNGRLVIMTMVNIDKTGLLCYHDMMKGYLTLRTLTISTLCVISEAVCLFIIEKKTELLA